MKIGIIIKDNFIKNYEIEELKNLLHSNHLITYIFSEKTVEVIGNSICNLYGGLVEILDGPSTIKGSRTLIPGFPATAREYLQTLKNILGG